MGRLQAQTLTVSNVFILVYVKEDSGDYLSTWGIKEDMTPQNMQVG